MPYTIAVSPTDRTYPLIAGEVASPELPLTIERLDLEEIFKRQIADAAFDIAECTLGSYLIALSRGETRLTAIPVPLMRRFRRDQIYVRADSPLHSLESLRDKKFGLPEFQATPGIWLRAILRAGGIGNDDIEWITYRPERIPLAVPARLGQQRSIGMGLLTGEIDAGFFPRRLPLELFPLNGKGGKIRRLLDKPFDEDRAAYLHTKIFPIGSILTIRTTTAGENAGFALGVYELFLRAKAAACETLMDIGQPAAMEPFLTEALERSFDVLGADLWPYGFKANRPTLVAFIDHLFEDGLLERRLTPEEVFHPATLDT